MVSLQTALAVMALSGVGETVFYDFHADWCGPCRAMAPAIQALVEKGYPVRKVNIDQDPELAERYKVRAVPCFVMVVDGQEVDRAVGGTTFSRLERMCKLASAARSPRQASPAPSPATVPKAASQAGLPESIPAVQNGTPFSAVAQPAAAGEPRVPAVVPPTLPGRPKSAPGWTAMGQPGASPDADLIAASVRLRIEDPQGQSCGSGTIIDARAGEALILTCGHIFRDSKGRGRIEVDLLGPCAGEKIPARLISYDLERDIGLVCIRTPGPVTAARVAPPNYKVAPGAPVISVGCNNGDRPSALHSRVTSLDKFLPPPNLQVAGMPVEGRSGGGLFSRDGLLIGVCNAADPSDREGLYAALGSIHAELEQAKLAFVFNPEAKGLVSRPAEPKPRAALVAVDPPPMPTRMPRPSTRASGGRSPGTSPHRSPTTPWSSGNSPRLNSTEQAAMDEVRRRLQQGAEVIFVVRSRRDPNAKSEIFTLENASPEFLRQLALESRTQHSLHSTSLEVPRAAPSAVGRRPRGESGAPEGRRPERAER